MMTDIYADMANKSKENVRHEKWRVQHLGRPFDIFFQIWFISHFKFYEKWTGNPADYRIFPKQMT